MPDLLPHIHQSGFHRPAFRSIQRHRLPSHPCHDRLDGRAFCHAGTQGQISGDDLFDKLMATAATITNDPDRIKSAKRLSDAGVIPEFMQGLPYKSKIMELSNEIWASWGPDQQDGFLENLSANIVLYQAIHDSPDNWVPLNEGDDVDEYVYPISLKNLP